MNEPLKAWVRALELTAPIARLPTRTLPSLVDGWGERFGDASALISRSTALSYQELAKSTNRYARWSLAQGLTRGDVVCLLMPNSTEYLPIWLGLTRVGVVVSLLNTNLTGELLAHSIKVVNARLVITGASLYAAAMSARPFLSSGVSYWVHGPIDGALSRLDECVASFPGDPLESAEYQAPSLEDRALHIYTSGTTGLPKAAIVTHFRIMQWAHWFAGMMNTRATDRMYDCLPLYHSVGGVVATGATLVSGGSVVLRERFSAGDFWTDILEQRCTVFQYIGELCRYLLAGAPRPEETRHALRLCCGNGLRGEVWTEFQRRFRIPEILEYYASTEGSFSLYNCEGRVGAIGRIPPFLRHRMRIAIVKFDTLTEMPIRDTTGRCVPCAPGEAGEALGAIAGASGEPSGRFEGYAEREASERKILRDVFSPGDAWYRTGDLMRQDAEGYFYFIDRVGDTFRWKGENVSTTEVTAVITSCRGVRDAVVYGVAVRGTDGRAGMAALVIGDDFDLGAFASELERRLPDYARPVFLRIVPRIETTGTFKLRKQELALEGYDRLKVVDTLYLYERAARRFVVLDANLYEQIGAGRLRL